MKSLRFGIPSEWRCNEQNCHNYYMFGFMDLLLALKDFLPGKDYKMIEIGSYMGESTMLFASTHIFDVIFSIDPHEGNEEFNEMNGYDWDFIKNEYALNTRFFNNIVHLADYSYNISNKFKENSIDFIYIDGNHSYKSLKKDFELFLPKLKKGGIIAGHDYDPNAWPEVIKAIHEEVGEPDIIFNDSSWIKKL
jgi:predicted O-methyltransferase YrrM